MTQAMTELRIKPFSISAALFEALMELECDPSRSGERRREAGLPDAPWARRLERRLTTAAERYAAEVLGTTAVLSGRPVCNLYGPGDSCQAHIDQEGAATHAGPETLHRTVSASLIVLKAERGGAMLFQDYARTRPVRTVDPDAGKLLLYPADWWHKVLPIGAGARRSVVAWWASADGAPFRSEPPGDA